MSKLSTNEQKILSQILTHINTIFDRIALRLNKNGSPIINSACYGDLATRDSIKNPVEGQIFFVLADSLEVDETEST